jgi:hypothetical protein
MSHKGNDIFRESLQENRLEKVYEAITPDRCYTSYDRTDKVEVAWRLAHCFNAKPKAERVHKNVILPKSDDTDYWREREDQAKNLREVYREAQLYRDL